MRNLDPRTVEGFGREWTSFDQSGMDDHEKLRMFEDYFHLFPWHLLPTTGAVGADIGCGSGRWAILVARRVGLLHLVDPSLLAIEITRKNLRNAGNCRFHHASVDELPFSDNSLDFAYSLGVLHHVPDTAGAIRSVGQKLRPGAPFLVYLYYAFDNRPWWFRALWRMSDIARRVVSVLPYPLRYSICQLIAFSVYWPLARMARLVETLGLKLSSWPLMYYRDKSFYVMRTDALDRFGTRLEQRFRRERIANMLEKAGFQNVRFSDRPPFWCAVAIKK